MSLLDETTSSDMDLPERGHVALAIDAEPYRIRAMFAGHVIADSDDVLVLRRPGFQAMRFFPRGDVETGYLGQTHQTISDPDLGEAACYTWSMDGDIVEMAACAFESPPLGAEALRGRLCLSDAVFELYELTPSDLAAAPRAVHPHGGAA